MTAHLSTRLKLTLGFIFLVMTFSFLAFRSIAQAQTKSATLKLTPATVSTSVGQTFTLGIELNTGGANSDGARVILKYDKNLLTATKITPGTIFKEYPSNAQSIDTATGILKVSGIADTTSTYNGTGTFASVEFTAKAPGTVQVGFDFTPGSTTDTNVATTEASTGAAIDILTAATGSAVTIAQGTIGGPTSQPRSTLPDTASISPTVMLFSIGGALIFLGLAVFFAI